MGCLQLVEGDERAPSRAQPRRGSVRSRRRSRQATCAAARSRRRRVRGRPRHHVGRDRGARAPRLPVLDLDVPMDVAIAELFDRRQHPGVVMPVAERTAEPRSGIAAGRGRDGLGGVSDVAPEPVVGEQPHPSVVVGMVADEVAVRRDPRRGLAGAPSPSVPGRRTSHARRAALSAARMRWTLPGGHQGRSGCSASKVSATRIASLTGRHLRGMDVGARLTAGRDRQVPGEELGGHDRHGRAQQRVAIDPIVIQSGPRSGPASTASTITAVPRIRQLPGEREVEVVRGSSVAMTMAASPARPARAARAGTARSGATRPAIPTASFSVSAPISAAARAPPRPRITVAARPPCHAASRSGRSSPSRASIPAAAASAAGDEVARPAGPPRRARSSAQDRDRGGERHRGGAVLRPRPGVEHGVGELGERAALAVRHGDDERRLAPLAERPRHGDGLGALARLAHQHQDVVPAQDRQPEVQQLGRVQHRRGDPAAGELGHGRVAGVVGAPHPRERRAARGAPVRRRRRSTCPSSAAPAAARRRASG